MEILCLLTLLFAITSHAALVPLHAVDRPSSPAQERRANPAGPGDAPTNSEMVDIEPAPSPSAKILATAASNARRAHPRLPEEAPTASEMVVKDIDGPSSNSPNAVLSVNVPVEECKDHTHYCGELASQCDNGVMGLGEAITRACPLSCHECGPEAGKPVELHHEGHEGHSEGPSGISIGNMPAHERVTIKVEDEEPENGVDGDDDDEDDDSSLDEEEEEIDHELDRKSPEVKRMEEEEEEEEREEEKEEKNEHEIKKLRKELDREMKGEDIDLSDDEDNDSVDDEETIEDEADSPLFPMGPPRFLAGRDGRHKEMVMDEPSQPLPRPSKRFQIDPPMLLGGRPMGPPKIPSDERAPNSLDSDLMRAAEEAEEEGPSGRREKKKGKKHGKKHHGHHSKNELPRFGPGGHPLVPDGEPLPINGTAAAASKEAVTEHPQDHESVPWGVDQRIYGENSGQQQVKQHSQRPWKWGSAETEVGDPIY